MMYHSFSSSLKIKRLNSWLRLHGYRSHSDESNDSPSSRERTPLYQIALLLKLWQRTALSTREQKGQQYELHNQVRYDLSSKVLSMPFDQINPFRITKLVRDYEILAYRITPDVKLRKLP